MQNGSSSWSLTSGGVDGAPRMKSSSVCASGTPGAAPIEIRFWIRWVCPRNFAPIPGPAALRPGEVGVVYLRLRKPER